MLKLSPFVCLLFLPLVSPGSGASGDVAGATECSTSLAVVSAVAPSFPDLAFKARLFMEVPIDVTVNSSGVVTEAVLQAGTRNLFALGTVSADAAMKWQFNEAPNCEVRTATVVFAFKHPLPIGSPGVTVFKPPFLVEIFRTEQLVDTRTYG